LHPDAESRNALAEDELRDDGCIVAANGLHGDDPGRRVAASIDPRLARVIEAWPRLAEDVREAILSLVGEAIRG
jgi:hypothetical protein